VTKPTELLSVQAQVVEQPIGQFFIASIPARQLVEIAFADIRRLHDRDIERYLGIQRPLKEARVNAIRRYILGSDSTFPTAIIISIDEKCAEYDEQEGMLSLYPAPASEDADEVPFKKIAQILDGQHRLAGFLDEHEKLLN
jgi:DGQHR domain-containing protein